MLRGRRLIACGVLVVVLAPTACDGNPERATREARARLVLREAVAALKRYADANGGDYTRSVKRLVEEEGLRIPADMDLSIPDIDNTRRHFAREYCIETRFENPPEVYSFDNITKFGRGPCGNFWFD